MHRPASQRGRTDTGRGDGRRRGGLALAAFLLGSLALAAPAAAQEDRPLTIGGLLRAGFRFEPEESPRQDGFEIFDARLGLEGEIGIIFDYELQAEYADEDRDFRLLDARLILPFRPDANLAVGQFKAPFGRERLLPKGDIRFVDRAQASEAIAPGRQVGVEFYGDALESRLSYRAGIFNGNGRRLRNDDGSFLYAARLQYNTVGPIEFYEELVVQVGANVAFAADSAAELGPGLDGSEPGGGVLDVDFGSFRGDRFLWGVDLHASWHALGLDAEYLRGEFDPAGIPGDDPLVAQGGYVEGTYSFFGAIEGVARYDGFEPALGDYRDFLLLGLNVYPGFHAKFAVQAAFALGDAPPTTATELADGQVAIYTQVDF